MIAVLLLLACGGSGSPEATLGPDPVASQRAAGALCKVFQGARQTCTQDGGRVTAAGHTLDLTAVVTSEQTALGITSVVMQVQLALDGSPQPALTSRASAVGGDARVDLLGHAFHEWALVFGMALADALLADPARPALAAVDSAIGPTDHRGRPLYRGWTLLGGARQPRIDHPSLLALLDPLLVDLDGGWHSLSVQLDKEPGSAQWTCHVDGEVSAPLCEIARSYAWPLGAGAARVKQAWVLTPDPPAASDPPR